MSDRLRVLVCGGRDFNDADAVFKFLDTLSIDAIIQGGARGADSLARRYAETRGLPCEEFRADWTKLRRAAGPIRNQTMLDQGKPDLVVAFPGGAGTADMVRRANRAGVRVLEPGEPTLFDAREPDVDSFDRQNHEESFTL